MQYHNRSAGLNMPPATKHLMIVNVIVWLATFVSYQMWKSANGSLDPGLFMDHNPLYRMLGLHYWLASSFRPWQLLTYMFMHDPTNIYHIFCNMFSLWMFGGLIERQLGTKRYLLYYLLCGLGAALVQELVWMVEFNAVYNVSPAVLDQFVTVGASGAVFGILLAFGMFFPNVKMYIIPFPFPIKAKWVVIGYGVLELFFGISGTMSGVAHFAHLGGMIAGIIMILYWKHTGIIRRNDFY